MQKQMQGKQLFNAMNGCQRLETLDTRQILASNVSTKYIYHASDINCVIKLSSEKELIYLSEFDTENMYFETYSRGKSNRIRDHFFRLSF
jgi:hypothetical protein